MDSLVLVLKKSPRTEDDDEDDYDYDILAAQPLP